MNLLHHMKRIHHLPRKYITILRHGTESIQELLIVYLCTVLLCATIFSITEHQGEFNSIWWAFVTALTIGYGDFYPHTVVGKIDAVLLMHLVTLFILPIVIARMANKIVKDKDKFTLEEREEIKTILRKLDKR